VNAWRKETNALAKSEIALEPVTPATCTVLAQWLRRPHVAPWYPNPEENLAWAESPPPGGNHAIIKHAGNVIGYIRWQVVDRGALDATGLTEIPDKAVDVDILLGEAHSMGRGYGPAALRVLMRKLGEQTPAPPLIGLTSSVDNWRAHRAFVKAGFHLLRLYEPEGFGPCRLYVLPLQDDALLRPPGET